MVARRAHCVTMQAYEKNLQAEKPPICKNQLYRYVLIKKGGYAKLQICIKCKGLSFIVKPCFICLNLLS
jgi:hypothetical protein